MLSTTLVISVAFSYLLLLFAIAYSADRAASKGRSWINNPWVYALSMAVYCTAWTYFGSVGRAANSGVWFLPIYLGPTLAMILGWLVIRKIIRIAKTYHITSIADFIASRYGKSQRLAQLVTIITLIGIIPYVALQLKAIANGYQLLTTSLNSSPLRSAHWWQDSTFYLALLLAGFTIIFGARHLDSNERHEGMVAAIAFESIIKIIAFIVVGIFVTYYLFNGFGDIFKKAQALNILQGLFNFNTATNPLAHIQWFSLVFLSMLSVILLPRQFQVMVVESTDEHHLKRAVWVFPLYLLIINIFVLPIALAGLLTFGLGQGNPDQFVLSLPLHSGHEWIALIVFIGGFSAATGMVIVEATAVSTMVCNDLIMPWLLKSSTFGLHKRNNLTRLLLWIRRVAILVLLLLGYSYFKLAGDAYALVSIGLISFAAVAQFAPAFFGGMYWKGGTERGAWGGLLIGFAMWVYTLMLPSLAKSGWVSTSFITSGPLGIEWLKPEQFLGLTGLDNLTHALFWSLWLNTAVYVGLSLWQRPSAREASQALLFVDVFKRKPHAAPVFWQGQANAQDLINLLERFLGVARSRSSLKAYAARYHLTLDSLTADAQLVHFVETQLAGAIGSASARTMIASVVQEEPLELEDVMRILEEASQLRAYSKALEEKSLSLEKATAELRTANEQLKSLDRLKDDFMSSVTHELRTPLTSIRALTELMLDDPQMEWEQREQFMGIILSEAERLGRLVNQVLDMAKIEGGHAEWHTTDVDMKAIINQAATSMSASFKEKGVLLQLAMPDTVMILKADADRLLQVMLNLLSNALKFVPAQTGLVTVTLSDDPTGITVAVQDNGMGIAPEQQALVFEKFRQVNVGTQQGTGLGLPISRQIIEHFGGRMGLRSELGQGACFSFFLPRI
ncbi:sensor histidine kinase [Thiofilum flexile]|uniref:sensor histidine kinase n=1 Tax=Thiofilum flexile TaxID=125627 RepID=UPI0003813868|nr:sensor histidine kinase [Thiofilum flexile]